MAKLRVVGRSIAGTESRSASRHHRKYEKRMMEEAPYAYKAVEPVIESVQDAEIARKVARLLPLCTVKG